LRTNVLAIVAGLSLVTPVAAKSGRPNEFASIRIENFGRINPNYYRGAQPKGQDYSDLAALGVKTIINLESDDADRNEGAMAKRAGLAYLQIPMTTHVPPTSEKIAQFLRTVNDPAAQPVYVHCVGGRHRTGVMTAVYRMTQNGWSADQAFKEMKQYNFGADFLHPEFKDFVYRYSADHAATRSRQAVAAAQSGQ